MVFKRVQAERRASAADTDQQCARSETLRKALVQDGLEQLVESITALHALEARIQLVEDDLTAGEALSLPTLPKAADVGVNQTEPRLMEAALLIGAIARRMNLRLGAIERVLDDEDPLVIKPMPLDSAARMQGLKPNPATAAVA